MKIAIVHDWLITYAGAEKVLEQMLICYPEADLFSIVDFIPSPQRGFIQNKFVNTSFIQKLPFAKTKYRSYLPLMPLAIEQLDVSQYDLVISSSHAIAKGIITGPNQLHVCYIHTPMRYAWDLQYQYLKEANLHTGIKSFLVRWLLYKLRIWDLRTSNSVNFFIANSHYVSNRVHKFYRRDSKVIYPPVDLDNFSFYENKEDFYLTASRIVPYKKIDLIVEAFSQMPDRRLVVIGEGPGYKKMKFKARKNIEILGYQPNEVLKNYMQRAKAFVFAAEEDFGITPVEAQSCGTPVIAYGQGGVKEIIRDMGTENPTGVLFQEQNISSLINAVISFEKNELKILPQHCHENAKRFSVEKFRNEFKSFIRRSYEEFALIKKAKYF